MDTSVIVKWFVAEAFSAEALALREALRDGSARGATPDIAIVELGNALRYRFPPADADRVKTSIRSVSALGLKIIASSPGIVAESVDVAYAHGLAIYDAVFVTLSRDLGYPLVTADEILLERTASLGSVMHIKDWHRSKAAH